MNNAQAVTASPLMPKDEPICLPGVTGCDGEHGGRHNADLERSRSRLIKGNTYRDASTVCIVPTRGMIHAKVLQSWFNLMSPMNQPFTRIFAMQHEVAVAYNVMIEQILSSPLANWKYVLTLEEDNMPPPDGLIKLIEAINAGPLSAVGGLYWTKGEGGQPMIYGNPAEIPRNFRPQVPIPDAIQECCGLGMGFTLFRLDMFKDPRIERPWFRTEQSYQYGVGTRAYTQDLYFFEKAAGAGYRFACDTRVRVGHYDAANDIIW